MQSDKKNERKQKKRERKWSKHNIYISEIVKQRRISLPIEISTRKTFQNNKITFLLLMIWVES